MRKYGNSNGNEIFQLLKHEEVNLKLRFLIKSGYYIVPSPSTALLKIFEHATFSNVEKKV